MPQRHAKRKLKAISRSVQSFFIVSTHTWKMSKIDTNKNNLEKHSKGLLNKRAINRQSLKKEHWNAHVILKSFFKTDRLCHMHAHTRRLSYAKWLLRPLHLHSGATQPEWKRFGGRGWGGIEQTAHTSGKTLATPLQSWTFLNSRYKRSVRDETRLTNCTSFLKGSPYIQRVWGWPNVHLLSATCVLHSRDRLRVSDAKRDDQDHPIEPVYTACKLISL